jgi:hypothetical protein
MTPSSILTFELDVGTIRHQQATMSPTLVDTSSSVLAGAQFYTNTSVWLRLSAGLNVHTIDNGSAGGQTVYTGAGGAFGAGVDLVRRHYLVLDLEVVGIGAIDRKGALLTGGLLFGLSYY